MKNLRFLITVLALINAGLTAQVAAAPNTSDSTISTGSSNPTPSSRTGMGLGTE
ncbi:hypothetical protein Q0M94_12475 [Deinococcus radiomollis]|uniref:hypothetical protein n=1 Tax=Deinococcus radiomollis TaxID=468916 RepID=UPI0038922AF4